MEHEGEDEARPTSSPMYHVERQVYNQGILHGQLHTKDKTTQPLGQKIAHALRCSSKKAKSVLYSFFPILTWLPHYPVKEYLMGDVVSGISTGVMQLPQGLAYASLAAVPPVFGLYSSFFPVFLYTFFGTSRHISIGTFAVISLMIGGVAVREVPDEWPGMTETNSTNGTDARDAMRVKVAVAVTLLSGLIQLCLGLLRFGFVAIYLTEPLVRGFTTAAAVHVFTSQMKYLLGINIKRFSGPLSVLYSLIEVFSNITKTNTATLVIGLLCIVLLLSGKEINDRFKKKLVVPIPLEIIVVVIGTGVSAGMNLSETHNVDIVGNIPSGLSRPQIPDVSLIPAVFVDAIAIALVGFSMTISMAKIFSLKHGYTVDGNQELIALGICNSTGSFFQTFAVTCSISRSLVQEGTGGKTQIAGTLSSIMVFLVIIAIGYLFAPLPQTVLAAIVMVNLKGMFKQLADIAHFWRTSKIELAIWIVAFLASVFLGLDYGLLTSVTFAVVTIVYRTQSPQYRILGQIDNTDIYCDVDLYTEVKECPGIKIFQANAPLYFANSELFTSALKKKTGVNPGKISAAKKKARKRHAKELKQLDEQRKKAILKLANDLEHGMKHEVLENDVSLNGKFAAAVETPQNVSPEEVEHFMIRGSQVHSIILDFSPVNFVDSVGAKALQSIIKEYEEIGVSVYITACNGDFLGGFTIGIGVGFHVTGGIPQQLCEKKGSVMDNLTRLNFFEKTALWDLFFPSVHDAVLASQATGFSSTYL